MGQTRKLKQGDKAMKHETGKLMEHAKNFIKSRNEILNALVINTDGNNSIIDEIEKVIQKNNGEDTSAMIIFLMAFCSSSPKRLNLLRYRL